MRPEILGILRTDSRCGIGYFFNRCKEYGITYKTEYYADE